MNHTEEYYQRRIAELIAERDALYEKVRCAFDETEGRADYSVDAEEYDALIAERDDLRAKLDAYDETHMLLPLDADGVPIRIGDVLRYGDYAQGIVKSVNRHTVIAMHVDDDNLNYAKYGLMWEADGCHHVAPRTVEDVLVSMIETAVGYSEAHTTAAYTAVNNAADELREIMEAE